MSYYFRQTIYVIPFMSYYLCCVFYGMRFATFFYPLVIHVFFLYFLSADFSNFLVFFSSHCSSLKYYHDYFSFLFFFLKHFSSVKIFLAKSNERKKSPKCKWLEKKITNNLRKANGTAD